MQKRCSAKSVETKVQPLASTGIDSTPGDTTCLDKIARMTGWRYLSWLLGHTRLRRTHRTASPMDILPSATKRAQRRPFDAPSSLTPATRCLTQSQERRFSLRKTRDFTKSSSAVAVKDQIAPSFSTQPMLSSSPATCYRQFQKATLFLSHFPGHCFRLIPSSCIFASSAFPVPPSTPLGSLR